MHKNVLQNIYNLEAHTCTFLTSALPVSNFIFFLPVTLLCRFGSTFKVLTSGEAGRELLESVLTLESFLGSWSRSTSSRSSDTHSSSRLLTDSVCRIENDNHRDTKAVLQCKIINILPRFNDTSVLPVYFKRLNLRAFCKNFPLIF